MRYSMSLCVLLACVLSCAPSYEGLTTFSPSPTPTVVAASDAGTPADCRVQDIRMLVAAIDARGVAVPDGAVSVVTPTLAPLPASGVDGAASSTASNVVDGATLNVVDGATRSSGSVVDALVLVVPDGCAPSVSDGGNTSDAGAVATSDATPAPLPPPENRPNGAACSAPNQCGSGFCVGNPGRCCNSACNGECQACGTGYCEAAREGELAAATCKVVDNVSRVFERRWCKGGQAVVQYAFDCRSFCFFGQRYNGSASNTCQVGAASIVAPWSTWDIGCVGTVQPTPDPTCPAM